MNITDYLTCSNCKETYLGVFKVDKKGIIKCIDCNDRIIINKHKIIKNNNDLEQKMVFYFLEEDIERLYPLLVGINELKIDMFLKENGELDEYKLFFQGNDLDFCKQMRDISYMCLKYIETNKVEYYEFSKEMIKKYLDLRFYKLSKTEKKEYIELMKSKSVSEINLWIGDI